jgi:hypothetical protein
MEDATGPASRWLLRRILEEDKVAADLPTAPADGF